MEDFPFGAASAECDFYGDRLTLLEGVIEEFLSCLHMIRQIPGVQILRKLEDTLCGF